VCVVPGGQKHALSKARTSAKPSVHQDGSKDATVSRNKCRRIELWKTNDIDNFSESRFIKRATREVQRTVHALHTKARIKGKH